MSVSGIELWPPLLTAIRMLGRSRSPAAVLAGVRSPTRISHRVSAWLAQRCGCSWHGDYLARRACSGWTRNSGMLPIFGALPLAAFNYAFAERYRQEPEKVA
jgi:hypothetical protein